MLNSFPCKALDPTPPMGRLRDLNPKVPQKSRELLRNVGASQNNRQIEL